MSLWYTIEKGDDTCLLGNKYGLPWRLIWEHGNNAPLREKRSDPQMLLPGDTLWIPDVRPASFSSAAGTRHRFEVAGTKVRIAVVLCDADGNVYKGKRFEADFAGRTEAGQTTDTGLLELEVPVTVRAVDVWLWTHDDAPAEGEADDPETARRHATQLRLWPGCLAPYDTIQGAQQRLGSLGYACKETGELDDATRGAVTAFQKKQGIHESGELDDSTMNALKNTHDKT